MTRREFPNAVEIEKKLLSAMMLRDGKIIPQVVDILNAEDFYREQHRMIFRAMVALHNRAIPPDALIIEEELKKRGELERLDRSYLFSIVELEFSTARAISYAETIRDKATLRRLINAGLEIADEASDERNVIEEVMDRAEKRILTATSQSKQASFEELPSVITTTFEQIFEKRQHRNEIFGVPTGLQDLDKVTNGFQKSDLIILAARPSMGKTALAINMALGAAKKGKSVAIFSLEMSKIQLGNRLLSLESGVNSQYLNTGNFSNAELEKVADAIDGMERLKLFIDDTAGISLLEMRSKARRLKHERGLDWIIIDYLQLMTVGRQANRQENRQQEISEISRSLKAMARELDVPVLALSQLSRSVEMRAEKKPQLSDLRESGALEQDADIVIFLYRDEYYNRDNAENKNKAEVIFAKNRNGPTTSIMMQFQKETMHFGDLVKEEK